MTASAYHLQALQVLTMVLQIQHSVIFFSNSLSLINAFLHLLNQLCWTPPNLPKGEELSPIGGFRGSLSQMHFFSFFSFSLFTLLASFRSPFLPVLWRVPIAIGRGRPLFFFLKFHPRLPPALSAGRRTRVDLKPDGPASGNARYLLLYRQKSCCRDNTTVPVSLQELSVAPTQNQLSGLYTEPERFSHPSHVS